MKKSKYYSRSRAWLTALLLGAVLAGCGGQDPVLGTGGAGAADVPASTIVPGAVCSVDSGPTIPTATNSDPVSGATSVAISTVGVANNGKLITATFSMAMDPVTVVAPLTFTLVETLSGNSVAGTVTMNPANTVATLTTAAALLSDTSYTVIISTAAESADGVAIACSYEWSFTTAVAATVIVPGAVCAVDSGPTIPTATSSNPTSGNQFATTSTDGVVNSGKLIIANFSLAMDPATINSDPAGTLLTFTLKETVSGNDVPGTVALDIEGTKATLTTAVALLPDTSYTASITTAAESAADGTPIACAYEWEFRTVTPAATGLAPINLGRSAPFGIAATAGITNTPTVPVSHINGDVVLDAGITCNAVDIDASGGFGLCGSNASTPTLTGMVISPLFPDAGITSGAIKSDLQAAFLSITPTAGPPAAGSLDGATSIAAGTTLGEPTGAALVQGDNLFAPGLYQSLTSIVITGDLTLDGQGDENALFVFQSSSSLDAAAGAPAPAAHTRILLINGAKASNVWWQVATSATLGLYAEWNGNILSSAHITMETGAVSCGRLFAGAFTDGAFVLDSNVISVPGDANAPVDCQ